jgi:selenocysteine lyase/cysteine desulfurase
LKPHAGRWEGGALNVPGLLALGASLDLLLDAGIDTISSRVLDLTDYLCERARGIGFDVFSSRDGADRSGIVALTKPGVEPRELMKRCRAAGVIVNNRANRLRVSPHAYNTPDEIDRLIEVLK